MGRRQPMPVCSIGNQRPARRTSSCRETRIADIWRSHARACRRSFTALKLATGRIRFPSPFGLSRWCGPHIDSAVSRRPYAKGPDCGSPMPLDQHSNRGREHKWRMLNRPGYHRHRIVDSIGTPRCFSNDLVAARSMVAAAILGFDIPSPAGRLWPRRTARPQHRPPLMPQLAERTDTARPRPYISPSGL